MKKLDKVRMALKNILLSFGSISTDKATLTWDGEDEIAVDTEVYVIDEEGNHNPAEDGEYTDEAGKIYVVENSIVKEIREPAEDTPEEEAPAEEEPAAEEASAEEPEAAEPEVENPTDDGEETDDDAIAALRKEVNELFAVVDALVKRVEAIEGRPEEDLTQLRADVAALNEFKETVGKLSAAPTAHQEFQETKTITTGKNKDLDGLAKLFQ